MVARHGSGETEKIQKVQGKRKPAGKVSVSIFCGYGNHAVALVMETRNTHTNTRHFQVVVRLPCVSILVCWVQEVYLPKMGKTGEAKTAKEPEEG